MSVRYAKIVANTVVEVADQPIGDGTWLVVTGAVAAGWKLDETTFHPPLPPPLVPTSLSEADTLAMAARVALSQSDITLLRLFEDGKPVTKEWKDYRKALRKLVTDKVGTLPTNPAFVDEGA